jgi:hypothetical protein
MIGNPIAERGTIEIVLGWVTSHENNHIKTDEAHLQKVFLHVAT